MRRKDPHYWSAFFHGFVFACLAIMVVTTCGCATPESVRRLEAESVASIEAYHDNAEAAVEALLGAYRDASYRELDALAELALAEEVEVVVETDGENVSEREIVRPDIARQAVQRAVQRAQQIEAEVDRFSARWEAAGADYSDALRLRGRLKDYLEAGGVQPEQVETLAEALAREIERRRKD